MIIIGDVHGKTNEYWKLLLKHKQSSIQLGDFGFKTQYEWLQQKVDSKSNKIIFGNHDYYPMLNCRHSLGDYSINGDMMTVRGADSIDKDRRTEGIDWFREEEMDYMQMRDAIDVYESHLPRIVISHDCPQTIMNHLFGYEEKSRTRLMLEEMFEINHPEIWIFGHHHKSIDVNILGTRFICLNELEVFELPDYKS